MRATIALTLGILRLDRVEFFRGEQIVKRHNPVGKIVSKSTHIADGKDVRCDRQRVLTVVECADAAAGEQRLGADAGEPGDGIGAAAQQGQ